jgi:hypothetical protein
MTTGDFTIHEATDGDAPVLVTVLRAAFAEQATFAPPSGALSETPESIRALMQTARVGSRKSTESSSRTQFSVRLALPRQRAYYERLGYRFVSYGTHAGFSEPTSVTLTKVLNA